jgi:hypothetical protein
MSGSDVYVIFILVLPCTFKFFFLHLLSSFDYFIDRSSNLFEDFQALACSTVSFLLLDEAEEHECIFSKTI